MKIVIIGAGFGGLAAAALLAQDGHDVIVVEKNSLPGGRANKFEANGFSFDMGPSWYLMPDIFENFFKQLGTTPEKEFKITKLDPSYTIYFENERLDIKADIEENYKTFELLEKGSSKRLKEYLRVAKKQYDVAINKFIYREYLTVFDLLDWQLAKNSTNITVFGNLHNYVSKFFTNEKIRKILEYSMVFLGGAPKNTPALYSIMSHVDLTLGVFYPQGGMHTVAVAMERLAKEKGAKFIYDTEVKKILVQNKNAVGVETNSKKKDHKIITADKIIGNGDYHHIETKLLEKQYQTYPEKYWEKRTVAPSGFIMFLGLDKKIKGLTHHNLFLAHDWMKHFNEIFSDPKWPDKPSYYVCAPSFTDPSVAPKGKENLFVLVPVASGLEDTPEIREKYEKRILENLEENLGENITNHIIFKRTFAHKDFSKLYHAYKGTALGLTHTLRQTALFRPLQKSKKVKNLYFVGQYTHPGVGVPMVIISAQIIANMIKNGR